MEVEYDDQIETIIYPKKYYKEKIKYVTDIIATLIFNKDGDMIYDLDKEMPFILQDIAKNVKNRKKISRIEALKEFTKPYKG